MSRFVKAVISGFAFLTVWLLLAALMGEALLATFWIALATAVAFGLGIYFFSDPRGDSASTDSKKKI